MKLNAEQKQDLYKLLVLFPELFIDNHIYYIKEFYFVEYLLNSSIQYKPIQIEELKKFLTQKTSSIFLEQVITVETKKTTTVIENVFNSSFPISQYINLNFVEFDLFNCDFEIPKQVFEIEIYKDFISLDIISIVKKIAAKFKIKFVSIFYNAENNIYKFSFTEQLHLYYKGLTQYE